MLTCDEVPKATTASADCDSEFDAKQLCRVSTRVGHLLLCLKTLYLHYVIVLSGYPNAAIIGFLPVPSALLRLLCFSLLRLHDSTCFVFLSCALSCSPSRPLHKTDQAVRFSCAPRIWSAMQSRLQSFAFVSLFPLLLLYTSTAIAAMQKIDIESNTEIKRALPLYRLPGRCKSLSLSSGLS